MFRVFFAALLLSSVLQQSAAIQKSAGLQLGPWEHVSGAVGKAIETLSGKEGTDSADDTQALEEDDEEIEEAKEVETVSPKSAKRHKVGAALGRTAPLSELGLQRVKKDGDRKDFRLYINRLLAAEDRSVTNMSKIRAISATNLTLHELKRLLRDADWVSEGVGRRAPLSQKGLEMVKNELRGSSENPQMKAYIRRIVSAQGNKVDDESAFTTFVGSLRKLGLRRFKDLSAATETAEWASSTGTWIVSHPSGDLAPLNKHGYQVVAKLKSDTEMKSFIERVLWSDGLYVLNLTGLDGMVADFSGTLETQDFRRLRRTLQKPTHAWWIGEGIGRTAELSQAGYEAVVRKRSSFAMKAFMRRIAAARGRTVDEAKLSGMAPFFSGKANAQSFDSAERAVLQIS